MLLQLNAPGIPETVVLESCRDGRPSEFCVISGSRLGGWNVADRLKQPPMIEPVDPFERSHLNGLQVVPQPTPWSMVTLISPYRRQPYMQQRPDRLLHRYNR